LSQLAGRQGDEHGPFEGINPKFPWEDKGKPRRTSVKPAVNPTGIRIVYTFRKQSAVMPLNTVELLQLIHFTSIISDFF
jgi:hypothetical protein